MNVASLLCGTFIAESGGIGGTYRGGEVCIRTYIGRKVEGRVWEYVLVMVE